MTSKNVKRADLANAVYLAAGLPRHEAASLVEQVLGEICAMLERGESVKLSGFGVFTVRDKAKRTGRNPKTGQEVPIEPRRSVTFTASKILKDHVNSIPVAAQKEGQVAASAGAGQMALAEEIMHEDRDILRALAK
jgi:integration host factor subunit alpha